MFVGGEGAEALLNVFMHIVHVNHAVTISFAFFKLDRIKVSSETNMFVISK